VSNFFRVAQIVVGLVSIHRESILGYDSLRKESHVAKNPPVIQVLIGFLPLLGLYGHP
jgi:hypothetical protein